MPVSEARRDPLHELGVARAGAPRGSRSAAQLERASRPRARPGGSASSQHPVADRHDQPGLLGERDELAGEHEPALRMAASAPAPRRRSTRRRRGRHRLVVQHDLVALERAAQLRPPARSRSDTCSCIAASKSANRALAACPWPGTSRCRRREERLGRLVAPRREGDADRGARCRPSAPPIVERLAAAAASRCAIDPPRRARSDVLAAAPRTRRRPGAPAVARRAPPLQALAPPRCSSSSPTAWPSESLTILKRSRSRKSTASVLPRASARAIAWSQPLVEAARGSPAPSACRAGRGA